MDFGVSQSMMKMIPSLIVCFFLSIPSYGKSPVPEDALAKTYWSTLNEEAKSVFLVGFRHGIGPGVHDPDTLRLQSKEIPKLIPLLDSFYKTPENSGIYLKSAIQICLMQLKDKPKAEIEELTRRARDTAANRD
jgi:hypothetical protein